jgi:YfiR/HmsC-like
MIVLCSKYVPAQDMNYKSYTLLMYNIAKNIEWPKNDKTTFTIGVLGNSPAVIELQELAKNKKLYNRTIIIKQFNDYAQAKGCDILYITSSKSSAIKLINLTFKEWPILTIGEREGLAKKGACISFFADEQENLSFQINSNELKSKKLKASSSLLQLGEIIDQ